MLHFELLATHGMAWHYKISIYGGVNGCCSRAVITRFIFSITNYQFAVNQYHGYDSHFNICSSDASDVSHFRGLKFHVHYLPPNYMIMFKNVENGLTYHFKIWKNYAKYFHLTVYRPETKHNCSFLTIWIPLCMQWCDESCSW